MNLKDVILERYDVSENKLKFLVFTSKKDKNKNIEVWPANREIFIALQDIPEEEKKQENVEKLIAEGKGVLVSCWELYKMFSTLTEDELYKLFYGYSKRTHEYFKAIERNIGLIAHEFGHEEEDFEPIKEYDMFWNTGTVKVGRIGNKYVAQFGYRAAIDDYCIERIYFDHLPSRKDIETAILINDIKTYLRLYNKETFTCWECGRETHWLDINAKTLQERYDMLKDGYCGC